MPKRAPITISLKSSGEDILSGEGMLQRREGNPLVSKRNSPRENFEQTMRLHQTQEIALLRREFNIRAFKDGHILNMSDVRLTLLERHSSAIGTPRAVS